MIDEERLNLFVEMVADMLIRSDMTIHTREWLEDFSDNGILVEEDSNELNGSSIKKN